MRRTGEADGSVVSRQAFDNQHLSESIRGAAAEALGKRDAEKAQFSELLDQRAGENLVLIPFAGKRLDLTLGEVTYGIANTPMLFAELKIHQAGSSVAASCNPKTAGAEAGRNRPARTAAATEN